MVMPRCFSSGALSMRSKGVKSARPFAACTLVMAAVSVVFPWSMWPMVPTFMWGLVRSYFFFPTDASCVTPAGETCPALPAAPLTDGLGQGCRQLCVVIELHGIRRPARGHRAELRSVPKHLGQGHMRQHRL